MSEESKEVSSSNAEIKPQAPESSSGYGAYPNGDLPMYPVFYPGLVPGSNPMNGGGAGIYAVPMHQFAGQISGLPSNYLIPLTYNVPTTRPSNETENGVENQAQAQAGQGQQPEHQRQVIERRFQIAFQLDLFLILKLAAIIFLLHQDGSRQRLAALVISATIIYLYQTGALAPLVRWLSQGMQRAAAVPPPQRPHRPDNDPAAMPLNQDAVPGQENEGENGNEANQNENIDPGHQGNQWWGIVKEIQMIVFGFITSLLPGFHNID